jgi:hypothetical protein
MITTSALSAKRRRRAGLRSARERPPSVAYGGGRHVQASKVVKMFQAMGADQEKDVSARRFWVCRTMTHATRLQRAAVDLSAFDATVIKAQIKPVWRHAKRRVRLEHAYLQRAPGLIHQLYWMVNHSAFTTCSVVLIVANTVTLGMSHHGMSQEFSDNLDTGSCTADSRLFCIALVARAFAC